MKVLTLKTKTTEFEGLTRVFFNSKWQYQTIEGQYVEAPLNSVATLLNCIPRDARYNKVEVTDVVADVDNMSNEEIDQLIEDKTKRKYKALKSDEKINLWSSNGMRTSKMKKIQELTKNETLVIKFLRQCYRKSNIRFLQVKTHIYYNLFQEKLKVNDILTIFKNLESKGFIDYPNKEPYGMENIQLL